MSSVDRLLDFIVEFYCIIDFLPVSALLRASLKMQTSIALFSVDTVVE
jgi:hypothetical protein